MDSFAIIVGSVGISYLTGLARRQDLWKVALLAGSEETIRKYYFQDERPLWESVLQMGNEIPRVDNNAMLKAMAREKPDQQQREAISDMAIFGSEEGIKYALGNQVNHQVDSVLHDRIRKFSRQGYYR